MPALFTFDDPHFVQLLTALGAIAGFLLLAFIGASLIGRWLRAGADLERQIRVVCRRLAHVDGELWRLKTLFALHGHHGASPREIAELQHQHDRLSLRLGQLLAARSGATPRQESAV